MKFIDTTFSLGDARDRSINSDHFNFLKKNELLGRALGIRMLELLLINYGSFQVN